MTDPQVWEKILQPGTVDLVLCDMSPRLSGIKVRDQARSFELGAAALTICQQVLRPQGHLVIKVFPGEGLPEFHSQMKGYFQRVQTYSPEATRKTSSEIYLIGMNFMK